MNGVGFMISKAGLASGSRTRLDHSELLYGQNFYYSEKGQRNLLTQTPEGGWSVPYTSLSKGAIYFFTWLLTVNQKDVSRL